MSAEQWMAKMESRLTIKGGLFKKYPRTILLLFCAAILGLLVLAGIYQAIFPAPPLPAEKIVTVGQAWDMLFTVQIPEVWWVIIFLFLWLTKWS